MLHSVYTYNIHIYNNYKYTLYISIYAISNVLQCTVSSGTGAGKRLPATCFELKSGKSDEDEDKLACGDVKLDSLNTDVSIYYDGVVWEKVLLVSI